MNRQGSLRGSSLRVRREIGQSECPIDEVKKVSKDRKRSTVSNAASGEGKTSTGSCWTQHGGGHWRTC